mmetsp:Transcript_46054/g.107630  ORF Transcript_46054/g.107630 Transcript_46054/m.107630 type:complete len:193 (+) Transcript_46054:407-985(+)
MTPSISVSGDLLRVLVMQSCGDSARTLAEPLLSPRLPRLCLLGVATGQVGENRSFGASPALSLGDEAVVLDIFRGCWPRAERGDTWEAALPRPFEAVGALALALGVERLNEDGPPPLDLPSPPRFRKPSSRAGELGEASRMPFCTGRESSYAVGLRAPSTALGIGTFGVADAVDVYGRNTVADSGAWIRTWC